MARRPSRIRITVSGVGAALLLLAACGTSSVDQDEVERQVSQQLTKQVGQEPDSIDCPGDLEAEKGTTMRCTLTEGDESLGLTVTVTAVKDSKVSFDIAVDDK